MFKIRTLAATVALSAFVIACSGDADPVAEEKTAETSVAPDVPAGAPAADDVSTLDGSVLANFTGDAAAGKTVFTQCRTCHVTDAGVNKTGPSLAAIVGSKSGSVAGFNYSPANSAAGVTWSKEKLFQFLEKPQRVMPKTKMIFIGISDPQKRADVIAYLENPS